MNNMPLVLISCDLSVGAYISPQPDAGESFCGLLIGDGSRAKNQLSKHAQEDGYYLSVLDHKNLLNSPEFQGA